MMKTHIPRLTAVVVVAAALAASLPTVAAAQSVRNRYTALQAREQKALARIAHTLPDAPAETRDAVIRGARSVIAGYDDLVRRYHSSGYADNALWNAAKLADALAARFNRTADRGAAAHYLKRLVAEYPTSSLVKLAKAARKAPPASAAPEAPRAAAPMAGAPTRAAAGNAVLTAIERTVLPEAVRITLLLDREVTYREERLAGPDRLFFDLKDVQVAPELRDVVLRYTEAGVRQIRVGRHPDSTVRVVLDLEGVTKYSVFTLYNPFRVVVDCEPASAGTVASAGVGETAPLVATSAASTRVPAAPPASPAPAPPVIPAMAEPAIPVVSSAPPPVPVAVPVPASPREPEPPADVAPAPAPPAAPRSNAAGGFSLSRQLGLGVTRIVIDPGHGGRDPGARARGLNEADLTLDVALRLEKLLQKEGLDVILTRRTDTYIPLEERTAIANRESADLFLSIHANASRNAAARGVETYFLSFASSPEAEAVAARENSASSGGMHNLPDIIKAIALNNKLDESRDFAGMVQEALVSRLRRSNKNLRNLGVKKAPFVVLISASMPSVLAEISFLTNKQELQLLKTSRYKQRVAEALHVSIMRYRRSLKGQGQIAEH
jgi:N-acetylmuramoyl-L-alanine amidase